MSSGGLMTTTTHRRSAGYAGVALLVLLSGVLFAPGAPPKANDSAATLAQSLGQGRTAIVVGMFVAGLAVMLAIWFFTALPGWVSSAQGSAVMATAAAGGGFFAVVVIVLGLLMFFGATFDAVARTSLPTVRGLTDAGNATIEMAKFGTSLFVVALLLATRGTDRLPRLVRLWGVIAVPVALVSAIALFSR